MWKKTVIAAAVAALSLPVRAAEPSEQTPPPRPADPPQPPKPDDETPTQLAPLTVEGERVDNDFKAEVQTGATKMALPLRETPQSVSVITRESLDARQVFNLQQAFELSAGVVQYSGNGPFAGQPSFGFNQTTIRGIAIDDIYDFRDDGFVAGSYFAVPDLAIYERVEVVKGPNSVLYGRGSVGGLINRVRKKPLSERRIDLELSGGSFDTYRADMDLAGAVTGSKNLRGRLVGVYEDSGSFVEGAELQRMVLAPSLEWLPTERTRVLLQALYQGDDINPNTGTPLKPVAFDDEGVPTRYDAPDISRRQRNGVANRDRYTWEIESIQLQLEQGLNDDWLATLRLSSANIDTPIQVDAYAYGFRYDADPQAGERVGDTSLIGSRYEIDRDVWSAELQLSGRFDLAGHEVQATLGADYNDNAYSRRGTYYNLYGFYGPGREYNLYDGNFERVVDPNPLVGEAFGGDPRGGGVYAQAQIAATQRLKVLLGARYDEVQLRSFSGAAPTEQQTVSDVTGRIGVTYELTTQISLYGLYAQSFQPVLFDLGPEGELLDPETGEIYELGAKTEWLDGRLGASAAIYRVDREDVPVGAIVTPGENPYSVSAGLQRSTGFEIEVNGQPLPGWDVSLAYNNVDSEFEDPRDPFYGNQPGGSADWQLGLYAAYEVQTGALRGLGLGLTRFEIADRGISTFVRGTIPGYERYDLHAFYKGLPNVEFRLLVRNLTDEIYIEGADRPGAYAQFGSPTAALLSVKYTLGQ